MGTTESTLQPKSLSIIKINKDSPLPKTIIPFIHYITKCGDTPLTTIESISKLRLNSPTLVEFTDIRNGIVQAVILSGPLHVSVKMVQPVLLTMKVTVAKPPILVDDHILGVENKFFESVDEFQYYLRNNINSRVELVIRRDGRVGIVGILNNSYFLGIEIEEGALYKMDDSILEYVGVLSDENGLEDKSIADAEIFIDRTENRNDDIINGKIVKNGEKEIKDMEGKKEIIKENGGEIVKKISIEDNKENGVEVHKEINKEIHKEINEGIYKEISKEISKESNKEICNNKEIAKNIEINVSVDLKDKQVDGVSINNEKDCSNDLKININLENVKRSVSNTENKIKIKGTEENEFDDIVVDNKQYENQSKIVDEEKKEGDFNCDRDALLKLFDDGAGDERLFNEESKDELVEEKK